MNDTIMTIYETRGQYWVFVWRPSQLQALVRKAATYAANPDLDFEWADVAALYHDCRANIPESAT